MKQELKTVYIDLELPRHRNYHIYDLSGNSFKTVVAEEHGIFFTLEEYNQHIQDVIEDALKTASEKAEVEVLNGYMEEPDEQEYIEQIFSEGSYRVKPYKESITNTFEETFKKYKL